MVPKDAKRIGRGLDGDDDNDDEDDVDELERKIRYLNFIVISLLQVPMFQREK